MFKSIFNLTKPYFGLEIGNASIKAMQIKKSGSAFKIIGMTRLSIPSGLVVDNEIRNENEVAKLIRKALDQSRPKKISASRAILALPINKCYTRIIDLPRMPKSEIDQALRWEAEKYIPLSPDQVYLDWQILKKDVKNLKIFLACAAKTFVDSYVRTLKKAKLIPMAFDLETTAEARALISSQSQKNYLIIDLGETKTFFFIYTKDSIPFSSTTTEISGSAFTNLIASKLKISYSAAENSKITCCSPKMSEKERIILKYLHSEFDNLAEEIKKIIDYFAEHFLSSGQIDQILLCGGGANLLGISHYLSLKLRKKVSLANPLTNLKLVGEPQISTEEALIFAKVIGLTLY